MEKKLYKIIVKTERYEEYRGYITCCSIEAKKGIEYILNKLEDTGTIFEYRIDEIDEIFDKIQK